MGQILRFGGLRVGYTLAMARRGGWRREGRTGRFRYLDSRGRRITDPEKIARIEELVIPPAWRDVWISPRPKAKLQATGVDRAGRRQYLYHPEFRARQEQEKFDKLVRFARSSYVSPAVVEQYLDERTIDDFRPPHLRVVGAQDSGLDLEEPALLALCVHGVFAGRDLPRELHRAFLYAPVK
jgi:DNA topoisomerase IB